MYTSNLMIFKWFGLISIHCWPHWWLCLMAKINSICLLRSFDFLDKMKWFCAFCELTINLKKLCGPMWWSNCWVTLVLNASVLYFFSGYKDDCGSWVICRSSYVHLDSRFINWFSLTLAKGDDVLILIYCDSMPLQMWKSIYFWVLPNMFVIILK